MNIIYVFLNFLITSFCNFFADCWFSKYQLELISVPASFAGGLYVFVADFLSKICKQLTEVHLDIHHILDF